MSRNITVTFLGTTSGGGPTETRNCSNLVVEPLGDGSLWMVDCAEGTVRQFALQPFNRNTENRRLRVSQVSKIFVTHMHGEYSASDSTPARAASGQTLAKLSLYRSDAEVGRGQNRTEMASITSAEFRRDGRGIIAGHDGARLRVSCPAHCAFGLFVTLCRGILLSETGSILVQSPSHMVWCILYRSYGVAMLTSPRPAPTQR
ncbi:hypothetical protein OH77DRAFT_1422895, partial [Trametes cingulata]